MAKESVFLTGICLFSVTDNAILIGRPDAPDNEQVWIPTSQIVSTDLRYDLDTALYSEGYIEIPRWLAEKKRLGGYG